MICILALVVFTITGIFSATHRQLAKEAFDCVFRKITLRPCNTGFDLKMKGMILGRLMNHSLLLTRLVNKYFELISWFFVFLTIASLFFSIRGLYNFYMYGSCNGLNQTGFCAFDPTGENNKQTQVNTEGEICPIVPPSSNNISLANVDLSKFPTVDKGGNKTVVFMGCYSCEYSRKAYPLMKKLLDNNQIKLIFIHFPAKDKTNYLSSVNYCSYKQDKDKFWNLNEGLFNLPIANLENEQAVNDLIVRSGFNLEQIQSCVQDSNTQNYINTQIQQLKDTGIYGTPTVFVNSTILVGPKPYSVYEHILRRWW